MLKKGILGLSFVLLAFAPLNAATSNDAGFCSNFIKNKWTKRISAAIGCLALYRTLNKGPQKEMSEEELLQLDKNGSKIRDLATFVDDNVLGSPGDALKGYPAKGLLGNLIAHWKAIVAVPVLIDQVEKNSPKIWNFLKDLVGIEAAKKTLDQVAVKAVKEAAEKIAAELATSIA